MASYTLGASGIAAHRKTLAANTVDTVTFANDIQRVEIVNHGTGDIFAAVDGSTAAVAGAQCFLVLPGATLDAAIPTQGPTKVTLISASAGSYTVQAAT